MAPPKQTNRGDKVTPAGKSQPQSRPATSEGGISPRSKDMISELTAVLEPYNYGEADIHNLVKSCNYDITRIQLFVANILEDKQGHEHDSWARTATSSEKKVKAQEAKERRLQLEKEKDEEAERIRRERTQKEDEKLKRLQEEATRRRRNERAAILGGPKDGTATASPAARVAWKSSSSEDEQATNEKPGEIDDAAYDVEDEPAAEANHKEATSSQWQPDAPSQAVSGSRPTWTPKVQQGTAQVPPQEAPQTMPSVPMPTAAPVAPPMPSRPVANSGGATLVFDDSSLDSSNVIMPESYQSLIGSISNEPRIFFGSLFDLSTDAAPSHSSYSPPTDASAAQPGRNRGGRSNWVPRESQDAPAEGAEGKSKGGKGSRKGRNRRNDSEQAPEHSQEWSQDQWSQDQYRRDEAGTDDGGHGGGGSNSKTGEGWGGKGSKGRKGDRWKKGGKGDGSQNADANHESGQDGGKSQGKGNRKGGRRDWNKDGPKGGHDKS